MKMVIAPDSFKGSLSAPEVCAAMELGVRRVYPSAEILNIPLADGGEGTLDALLRATGGRVFTAHVRGPLDQEIQARWGLLPNGTGIIEVAESSGLTLVPPEKLNALRASSIGVGQLLKAALDAGCRRFLIGLGGSATTDGASGALTALGVRFFDSTNVVLPLGGGALERLHRIDLRHLDPRVGASQIVVLCDVTNPLSGRQGAAHVFSPQKGATPEEVERLDRGLEQLAKVTFQRTDRNFANTPGAGAAGGLGFGLLSFTNAQLRPGVEVVLEASGFEAHLKNADLVLTGEGSLDHQTLGGKTVSGVCGHAARHQVPVIAFGGAVQLTGKQMNQIGLLSTFSITDGPRELEHCINNGEKLLTDAVERALRVWKCWK